MKIFAIKDRKADTFGTPFFQPSDVQAARAFRAEVNRANDTNMIYLYPEEWDLVEIGAYDEDTGKLTAHDAPISIANGIAVKNQEKK